MPPHASTGPRPPRPAALAVGVGVGAIIAGTIVLGLARIEPSPAVTDAAAIPTTDADAHGHDALTAPVSAATRTLGGLFGGASAKPIARAGARFGEGTGVLGVGGRADPPSVGATTPGSAAELLDVFAPSRYLSSPEPDVGD